MIINKVIGHKKARAIFIQLGPVLLLKLIVISVQGSYISELVDRVGMVKLTGYYFM